MAQDALFFRMEILEGRALTSFLLEKYSGDPRGWSFVVGPSKKYGFYDAIVSNRSQAWQLKMDSLFKPNPLVIGAPTEASHEKIGLLTPVNFGYRELDPGLVLRALKASYESEESGPTDEEVGLNLSAVLRSEPVVPRVGGSYAHGPYVVANQGIVRFVEGRDEIDDRLSSELLGLFRRRYPSYR